MTRRRCARPVSRGAAWLPSTDLPPGDSKTVQRRRAFSRQTLKTQTGPPEDGPDLCVASAADQALTFST